MNELQKAIEEITYASKKFPRETFEIITANREAAIPYLRGGVEKALKEKLEENYQLHFYALCLLGEFQDRDFFPSIIEFVSLPEKTLDLLIGDLVTDGLNDILYNTYNGDMELVKNTIMDQEVNCFVRAALLDVMGQLYLDGRLAKDEWCAFIKRNIYAGEEYSYIYNGFAIAICRCHFVDMLPEIRYMLNNDLMDDMCLGEYDSCVDEMFAYRDYEKNFCEASISAAGMLRHWAMFEDDLSVADRKNGGQDFKKFMKAMKKKSESEINRKIGRNDPCPCGSGKKYKFCCLNESKAPIDAIESAQERKKWLRNYPYTGSERLTDRVYLDDYFDTESIEIDKILYLGLMHRPGLIWERDEKLEQNRCREYLSLAFGMFMDKVKAEGIKTFEEYDQKFSIHYFCEEWISELLSLLKRDANSILYKEVKECYEEMSGR